MPIHITTASTGLTPVTRNVRSDEAMNNLTLDHEKTAGILQEYRGLDPHEVYYLKDDVRYERVGPLVLDTEEVLRKALQVSRRVLDVGCGRGRTLLDNSDLFEKGVGLDESYEHMIRQAIRQRDARGIRCVDFCAGKAVALPFEDRTFDLVFSERGPLGHSDATLVEALRVLKTEGLVFVETGGDFAVLEQEKKRFEGLGVATQILVSRTETLQFPDWYSYLRFKCIEWVYMSAFGDLPSPSDRERIEEMLSKGKEVDGSIQVPYSLVWIGGQKRA